MSLHETLSSLFGIGPCVREHKQKIWRSTCTHLLKITREIVDLHDYCEQEGYSEPSRKQIVESYIRGKNVDRIRTWVLEQMRDFVRMDDIPATIMVKMEEPRLEYMSVVLRKKPVDIPDSNCPIDYLENETERYYYLPKDTEPRVCAFVVKAPLNQVSDWNFRRKLQNLCSWLNTGHLNSYLGEQLDRFKPRCGVEEIVSATKYVVEEEPMSLYAHFPDETRKGFVSTLRCEFIRYQTMHGDLVIEFRDSPLSSLATRAEEYHLVGGIVRILKPNFISTARDSFPSSEDSDFRCSAMAAKNRPQTASADKKTSAAGSSIVHHL